MATPTMPEPQRKRDWALTEGAFRRFLDWLDGGQDSGGERYLEIRRRLVVYFDLKNCPFPDELADETLNRAARRLEEEGTIATDAPTHYCYIVARFVLLESLRERRRKEPLDDRLQANPDSTEQNQEAQQRVDCLEHCMNGLQENDRDLIAAYYQGNQREKIENRKALAGRLRITANALSIRACRIREKLEMCMLKCLRKKE